MAGGCPQKYVTGALVEGEIAALDMIRQIENDTDVILSDEDAERLLEEKTSEYDAILKEKQTVFTTEQLEEAMQKVMDTYAGGIGAHYQFNEKQLQLADEKILQLMKLSENLNAGDYHELMFVYELRERLTVCRTLIAHLKARKETRWHSFAENLDYPEKSDEWLKYVNSVYKDGEYEVIYRELVKRGDVYEHRN